MYCANCGSLIKDDQKFCGSCGTPVELVPGAGLSQPRPLIQEGQQYTNPQSETIKNIIPNLILSKSWGRSDTFNLIVTEHRSIFAKLTSQIMNETIKFRRDKATAEGKGFFGKWAAQMSGFNTYTDHYERMRPEDALGETEGNFQIENSTIINVKSRSDGDEDKPMYDIEITTPTQKLQFKTQYDPGRELKKAYG